MLVGSTSYGIKCADGKHPGVYARSSHYSTWINRVLNALSPNSSSARTPPRPYTFLVAVVDIPMFSSKSFPVLVPRGMRMVHFNASIGSQSADGGKADLYVQFEKPDYDCMSSSRLQYELCSFVTPLEGVYNVALFTEWRAVKGVRLSVTFEPLLPEHDEGFEIKNLLLAPNEKLYFLALPTVPGSQVHVTFRTLTKKRNPRVSLSKGVDLFALQKLRIGKFQWLAPTTATSLALVGDPTNACKVDLKVTYRTLRIAPTENTSVVEEFAAPLLSRGETKAHYTSRRLQVGTELGVRYVMESGKVNIHVWFGAHKAWTCPGLESGTMNYCGGIVPQYNQTIMVVLEGAASKYRLSLVYDAAG